MNALDDLMHVAIHSAEFAYAPYSKYRVGAALQTRHGRVFSGCNIENAAFPAGICAERTALVKAVSELPAEERSFEVIVVATRNGGAPCGVCRQMLNEFAPDLRVVLVDFAQTIHWDGKLSDLLPRSFGPDSL